MAESTQHNVHCTLYTTHWTWTRTCTWTCTCTLHTTHWTLHTAHHTFILHGAHLSRHTVFSQVGTQDGGGKINIDLGKLNIWFSWNPSVGKWEIYGMLFVFPINNTHFFLSDFLVFYILEQSNIHKCWLIIKVYGRQLNIYSLSTSWGPKLIPKAYFFKKII